MNSTRHADCANVSNNDGRHPALRNGFSDVHAVHVLIGQVCDGSCACRINERVGREISSTCCNRRHFGFWCHQIRARLICVGVIFRVVRHFHFSIKKPAFWAGWVVLRFVRNLSTFLKRVRFFDMSFHCTKLALWYNRGAVLCTLLHRRDLCLEGVKLIDLRVTQFAKTDWFFAVH